jgi:hypothetical protein
MQTQGNTKPDALFSSLLIAVDFMIQHSWVWIRRRLSFLVEYPSSLLFDPT